MEKFGRTLRGYDPEEVNDFLDKVIEQVEQMVEDIKKKDARIKELESYAVENENLKDKISHFENMEHTLNKAIIMAQKTSEQIKINAYKESETVFNYNGDTQVLASRNIVFADSTTETPHTMYQKYSNGALTSEKKSNANRIINEALIKAEKAEKDADMLQRNINIFKRRVRNIIEAQLEVVDELDDVEL